MSGKINNEPMLDMYIFETTQLIEQLEQLVINGEKAKEFSGSIDEIFRIMHTIKGSSAMMLYNNIAELSHAIEDLFYYLREKKPKDVQYNILSNIILDAIDFIKNELIKIESGSQSEGDATGKINSIKSFLNTFKKTDECRDIYKIDEQEPKLSIQKYEAIVFFQEGCEMENIRGFAIVHRLSEMADDISHLPENILEDDDRAVEQIRENGFKLYFHSSLDMESIREMLEKTLFLSRLELKIQGDGDDIQENSNSKIMLSPKEIDLEIQERRAKQILDEKKNVHLPQNQGMISVNITKTDRLMDLIGELVIAEAMVTQNPDLKELELDNFHKAARQLHKITNELQDVVMSIRMVPLSKTFHKMHRIIRDMSKKMDKDVILEIIGEETEVDKNIIDHISDPLMHLVRNAIDHGIEHMEDRRAKGKPEAGTVILEARHAGSDVLISVKDDGKGLSKDRILEKARKKGLIHKPEAEMSDREIFNLIFLPGFSTSDSITEFSGRGVGMDVVTKNIETVGGNVLVDSMENVGTVITLKIPLTLAIIDGMNVKVGNSRYTIPTVSIKESFRPNGADIICDTDGNEMIMVRGQCYPILRLHEHYGINTDIKRLQEGILIMVEHNEKSLCIFIDRLLGQQQVVVKALPNYIKNLRKIRGLGGCTLLGEGNISLILDIEGLLNN